MTIDDTLGTKSRAFTARLIAMALLAGGVYAAVQKPAFARLLRLDSISLTGDETWLLDASILATNLVVLTPALLLGTLTAWVGNPRWAQRAFIAACASTLLWLVIDLELVSSVGRHATEIARIAMLPEGHQAGGDLVQWAWTIALWAALALVWSSIAALAANRVVARSTAWLSPTLSWAFGIALALALGLGGVGPHLLHQAWRHHSVLERVYGTLPVDLRFALPDEGQTAFADPVLTAVATRLRADYKDAFSVIITPKVADPTPLELVDRPPNVVVIVAESLRHDTFSEELMPRLRGWARSGTLAAHHDAGTQYSEAGMFALLYGRSPVVYHSTLDAGVPPQLCVTLRASGYDCAYFTGHPVIWKRREEFLNAETMDRFEHDDRGSWPDWDRRALSKMTEAVNTSTKPVFALVFLMSSHFEYRYPPEYEIDTPVAQSKWNVTHTQALGDDAEIPHRNRYRNCMRFIDDLVSDAIQTLDPRRNLIVFTGDHGESINDDGKYTHGYSFAEITTRTPLVMVGPRVPKRELTDLTEHRDLVPTIAGLLAGQPVRISGTHGLDWYGEQRRTATMVAYANITRREIQAQLRTRTARLRLDLGARQPRVVLMGFEDELGRLLLEHGQTPNDADTLTSAFAAELDTLRH